MQQIAQILEQAARGYDGYVELRYHDKRTRSLSVEQGKLERSQQRRRMGVGVRVLRGGGWGLASTGSLDLEALRHAIEQAHRAARAASVVGARRVPALAPAELARGNFDQPGVREIRERSLEEKIALAVGLESKIRTASARVASASCWYNEIFEDKAIVTSDGASASFRLVRPEIRMAAVAEKNGELATGSQAIGVTGGWQCLFRNGEGDVFAGRAAQTATDLLGKKGPEGGRATVILAPSIVGLLVHEAIGHTVEADFVLSGSVAAGKLGRPVASELVTLCDSGGSEFYAGAAGTIPVDDEGVVAGRTEIIKNGVLRSYLHNRESAAAFGVEPTGNARAWEYCDQPLIRMRNTYMEPGESSLEEMIEGTESGFLLDGPRNGQADSTGEFMFGVQEARRIDKGKLGDLVKGVSISGIAFDVLASVDAVSDAFRWDLGSGYCGKGQPAKVDAGGPYIRCRAVLGGTQ